jgi:hypothetical protein
MTDELVVSISSPDESQDFALWQAHGILSERDKRLQRPSESKFLFP